MLTQRQHQLLQFIHGYLRDHGVPPSFEEMRAALRLRSKSGIHRLITGLEERGYIRRLAYRARALEVIRLPNGARLEPASMPGAAEANVVQFGRPAEQAYDDSSRQPCRCTAASLPARRSKRCAITRPRSRCRRICLAAAITTPSRWSATSMCRGRHSGWRSGRDRARRRRRQRRHRGGADRRQRGHAETAALQGPDGGARSGELANTRPGSSARTGSRCRVVWSG